MYSKNAFTLVELIVGITISMLLMTSVGILVSSGMQNILKQQNIMNKNSILTETVSDFYNGFENISSNSGHVYHFQSGAIFQIDSYMDKGGFGYLGITNQANLYCSNDSEFPNLDYLIWKSFIPYEEIGEDIFSNFSDIQNQTVMSGSINYVVDTINHQVLQDGIRIIGGDIFGHELTHNGSGTLTRLNNPTGIALAEGGFFLSDTLNHRILFYKDNTVYLLLDKSDGINQPTGLIYNNLNNILYISNSGEGEILQLSAENIITNPDLNISFSPVKNSINSISRISFTFPKFSGSLDPMDLSDFSFTNINNGDGYIDINGNTIDYYFTDYSNSSGGSGPIPGCVDNISYSLNGTTTPTKTVVTCDFVGSNTGTTYEYHGDLYENFTIANPYGVEIKNISPIFSTAGAQGVDIDFYNDSIPVDADSFYYFTQGDGIVNNLSDIKLSTLITGLGYPTGLNISGNDLEINDFISRKKYSYDLNNISSFSTSNLNDFTDNNIENIPYSSNKDILLQNPITHLDINYNNTDKYLSTQAKYYQYLNCYNPEEQVEKTLILQKNID